MADHPLSQRIADVLDLQPRRPAIEYDGRWLSWGQVGEAARRMASLTAGRSDDPAIGMLLRNRPGQVAAFLGVLLAGGTVVTINPSRGDERTRADIAALRLPLVVGEPDDLATLVDAPERRPCRSRVVWTSPASRCDPARDPVAAARRRGAHADQRNDRSAQANRPQLRHAGAQRDGSGSRSRAAASQSCDAVSRS